MVRIVGFTKASAFCKDFVSPPCQALTLALLCALQGALCMAIIVDGEYVWTWDARVSGHKGERS